MVRFFEDLRSFIGLFFLVVGALLVIQGVVNPARIEGINLNLVTGCGFLVFSLVSLALVLRAGKKNVQKKAR